MSKKSTDTYIFGIDPSSTTCGVAVLKNGSPLIITHHSVNKKLDWGRRIYEFSEFLQQIKKKTAKPRIVAVEELSISRNLNTTRKICYFESVGLLKAGQWNSETMLIKPNQARKKVIGFVPDKQETFSIMKGKGYKFCEGEEALDECDALVIALSAHKKLNYG